MKTFNDPVEVRVLPPGESTEQRPDQFLWKGRLYAVRSILGCWSERQAWWLRPQALVAHGQGAAAEMVDSQNGVARVGAAAADREIWRVEAGCGRLGPTGIYDLCHEVTGGGRWRLVQVCD